MQNSEFGIRNFHRREVHRSPRSTQIHHTIARQRKVAKTQSHRTAIQRRGAETRGRRVFLDPDITGPAPAARGSNSEQRQRQSSAGAAPVRWTPDGCLRRLISAPGCCRRSLFSVAAAASGERERAKGVLNPSQFRLNQKIPLCGSVLSVSLWFFGAMVIAPDKGLGLRSRRIQHLASSINKRGP